MTFLLCGCNNNSKKAMYTASLDNLINTAAIGNPKDLRDIINKIGDVNKFVEKNTPKGSYKVYLMHIAAKNTKYLDTVDILAENNVDINYYDEQIDPPLNIAVKYNPNPGIVTKLVKNGAKPWKEDYSVILLSAINENPNPEILKEVLNIPQVKELTQKEYIQCPTLIFAAQSMYNSNEKVKLLTDNYIKSFADVNKTEKISLEALKKQYALTERPDCKDAIKILENNYR